MKSLSLIASFVLFLNVAWAYTSYRSRIPNGFAVVHDGSSWLVFLVLNGNDIISWTSVTDVLKDVAT
jgi:hypothetical protein